MTAENATPPTVNSGLLGRKEGVPPAVTSEEFRAVIGYFSSGVTVVTTSHEGKLFGTTTSAVCSVSLEPPTLLICMNKTSGTGRAVARAGHFAVNILAEDQAAIARHFARKGDDKFDSFTVETGKRGAPLLLGALSTIQCRVVQEESAGTHYVFIAEVESAWASAGFPLAYYRGQFGRLTVGTAESGAA